MANRDKKEVFTGNMDHETESRILNAIGYKLGQLPFRYLGVSITARSLKKSEYETLLTKLLEE